MNLFIKIYKIFSWVLIKLWFITAIKTCWHCTNTNIWDKEIIKWFFLSYKRVVPLCRNFLCSRKHLCAVYKRLKDAPVWSDKSLILTSLYRGCKSRPKQFIIKVNLSYTVKPFNLEQDRGQEKNWKDTKGFIILRFKYWYTMKHW